MEDPDRDLVTVIPFADLVPAGSTIIGTSCLGTIHSSTWHGTPVAIQKFHLATFSDPLLREFYKEAELLANLSCPQILSLYGISTGYGQNAFVFEYMSKGPLYSFLLDTEQDFPWELRHSVAIDVCKAISYLHSLDMICRNLRSHSVLLDEHMNAKLCDIGLPKIRLNQPKFILGSVRWRPPESFKRGWSHVPSADIYSFGVILWEIASREIPFREADDDVVVVTWVRDGEKEKIPADCPPLYGDIIEKCWTSSPEKRPEAKDLLPLLEESKILSKPRTLSKEPKSWHFDPSIDRIASSSPPPKSQYQLIDASEKDKERVMSCYNGHPIPGYEISNIKVIFNSDFNINFSQYLSQLQSRKGKDAFLPNWSKTLTKPQFREKTLQILQHYAKPFVDPDYPDVTIVPTWYGTRSESLDDIFTVGYSNTGKTDTGFGKGIYSSFEAEYAHRVYTTPKGPLILNWVGCYLALPVIDGDIKILEGKSNYQNCDAHFAPVVPRDPKNTSEVVCSQPCLFQFSLD